jgi:hypothetical protein
MLYFSFYCLYFVFFDEMASRCRNFSNTGSCSFGDKCRYSHSEQASHPKPVFVSEFPANWEKMQRCIRKPWKGERTLGEVIWSEGMKLLCLTVDQGGVSIVKCYVAKCERKDDGYLIHAFPLSDVYNTSYQANQRNVQQTKCDYDDRNGISSVGSAGSDNALVTGAEFGMLMNRMSSLEAGQKAISAFTEHAITSTRNAFDEKSRSIFDKELANMDSLKAIIDRQELLRLECSESSSKTDDLLEQIARMGISLNPAPLMIAPASASP